MSRQAVGIVARGWKLSKLSLIRSFVSLPAHFPHSTSVELCGTSSIVLIRVVSPHRELIDDCIDPTFLLLLRQTGLLPVRAGHFVRDFSVCRLCIIPLLSVNNWISFRWFSNRHANSTSVVSVWFSQFYDFDFIRLGLISGCDTSVNFKALSCTLKLRLLLNYYRCWAILYHHHHGVRTLENSVKSTNQ